MVFHYVFLLCYQKVGLSAGGDGVVSSASTNTGIALSLFLEYLDSYVATN